MEGKTVEIKVRVDEDMIVSMNIPVEIEASRLMGMLEKAKRIAKVGMKKDVQRITEGSRHRMRFAPDQAKSFVKEYRAAKGPAKDKVAEKYGIPPEKAYGKYNYLHNIKKVA